MADRPASAASIRANTGPALKLKVTRWDVDFEIRYRRSVTSDFDCIPLTVFESAGGLIRGTGYVDPADTLVALILSSVSGAVVASNFDYTNVEIVLDVNTDAGGSRKGYVFGDCKIFPLGLTGVTDDAGMIEVNFEIHPKGQTISTIPQAITWSTTLT